MTPIVQVSGPSKPIKPREVIERVVAFGGTHAQGKAEYSRLMRLEWWGNEKYSVSVDRDCNMHEYGKDIRLVHISFHQRDQSPVNDWREMQEIKNAVLGKDAEAIALHPSEKRVVDTANEYHLWALYQRESGENIRMPFGFPDGLKVKESQHGATQRSLK